MTRVLRCYCDENVTEVKEFKTLEAAEKCIDREYAECLAWYDNCNVIHPFEGGKFFEVWDSPNHRLMYEEIR